MDVADLNNVEVSLERRPPMASLTCILYNPITRVSVVVIDPAPTAFAQFVGGTIVD